MSTSVDHFAIGFPFIVTLPSSFPEEKLENINPVVRECTNLRSPDP